MNALYRLIRVSFRVYLYAFLANNTQKFGKEKGYTFPNLFDETQNTAKE